MRQQAAQLFPQEGGRGGNVAFSQQDAVGSDDLLHPDGMLLHEHLRTIDGIDDGADMPDAELVTEHRVGLERSDNGRRLGQAGGFDDDALEMGNLLARPLVEQIEQRLLEFAAYLQHRQPELSRMVFGEMGATSCWSMPISPNSLISTAQIGRAHV